MTYWKMPPKAKIYEALSAVGDKRVRLIDTCTAEVTSSSMDKTYFIEWDKDIKKISSNDNASYWQGYVGYPIIAVLMLLEKITFRSDIAAQMAGIPWKELNTQFKRDYDKAINKALEIFVSNGGNPSTIEDEAEKISTQLSHLKLERGQAKKVPPK